MFLIAACVSFLGMLEAVKDQDRSLALICGINFIMWLLVSVDLLTMS